MKKSRARKAAADRGAKQRPLLRQRPSSQTEAGTDLLRDRIIDLSLAPGSRIDEKSLMARFGFGRTPLREALNRLAAEGLVILEPKMGAYVQKLDLTNVSELLEAYFAAERLIGWFCDFGDPALPGDLEDIQRELEQAVQTRNLLGMVRLNSDFHDRIALSGNNSYVLQFSRRMHNEAKRLAFFVYHLEAKERGRLSAQMDRILSDHRAIMQAIREADRDKLLLMLDEHAAKLQNCLSYLLTTNRAGGLPSTPGSSLRPSRKPTAASRVRS